MKHYKLLWLCLITVLLITTQKSISQTDTLGSSLDNLLNQSNEVQKTLKKQKDKESKLTANKIKQITRQLIRAVNSIPPVKCQKNLITAMDEFYELISKLSTGISCGPNIPPPFLPSGEDSVLPDCILPDNFNGAFSEAYPLYTNAIDIFRTNEDENNISDVCEGDN